MLKELSAIEWLEWIAYAQLAPFGEERQDYRIARVVQMLVNANRDTKKHAQPFTLYEVMNDLRFGDMPEVLPPAPTRRQTPEEQGQILRMMFGVDALEKAGAKRKR